MKNKNGDPLPKQVYQPSNTRHRKKIITNATDNLGTAFSREALHFIGDFIIIVPNKV